MKPSLQLKLSQHLTLTPQLQQSIRLLQLSTLELNQELERFLQENPLLERDEEDGDDAAGQPAATAGEAPQPQEVPEFEGTTSSAPEVASDEFDEAPPDLP
jgi:RNA polymerase sigma-54 factor